VTSWQLWRLIVHPPQTALYRRAIQDATPAMPWYVGCAELALFLLFIPLVLFIGPVYSLGWVIGMSGDIARTRETGTFDLLALTPMGPFGVSLALALACLGRIGAMGRINLRQVWLGRLMLAGFLGFMLFIYPVIMNDGPVLDVTLTVLLVLLAMLPDQVQSVALSVVVAMTGAEATRDRFTARWASFTLLLALQMGAYGAGISLYLFLHQWPAVPLSVAALVALVVLLLVREALFVVLWRALLNRFGAVTVLDLADAHRV
jgi:hypothetical protein